MDGFLCGGGLFADDDGLGSTMGGGDVALRLRCASRSAPASPAPSQSASCSAFPGKDGARMAAVIDRAVAADAVVAAKRVALTTSDMLFAE